MIGTSVMKKLKLMHHDHCVKGDGIRSYSGPNFLTFGDTPYLSVFSPNAGKYGPE